MCRPQRGCLWESSWLTASVEQHLIRHTRNSTASSSQPLEGLCVFFNQPEESHAYKSFQASAIMFPLPIPLFIPLGPFPSLLCFCRKQDRRDSVVSKCRRKNTDLERSETGFAVQLCQNKFEKSPATSLSLRALS